MIIVIAGPTASGKSHLSISLAKAINAEIVNGDAFQIYKEMDIGTAKTKEEEFLDIPHHLFSFVSPDEDYSVALYQKDARKVIDDILARGKNVVIVGGTGLYIRAALFDYNFAIEDNDLDMSNYGQLSNEELHNKLKELDLEESKKLHPNNRKRVLRAIEICLRQGKSKSSIVNEQEHKIIYDNVKIYAIDKPRDELYKKINQRVDEMFKLGLLDEVNYLKNKYGENHRSLQGIGYKETLMYLNNEIDLDSCKELIKKVTRNYAKRQITFFKHQFDTIWIKSMEDITL